MTNWSKFIFTRRVNVGFFLTKVSPELSLFNESNRSQETFAINKIKPMSTIGFC